MIEKLVAAGFMVNTKKTKFLAREAKILGYEFAGGGKVRPNHKKLDTLLKYTAPRTMKDLSSLYGLMSYFRKFVPRFSTVVAPISDMMKHDSTSKWTS